MLPFDSGDFTGIFGNGGTSATIARFDIGANGNSVDIIPEPIAETTITVAETTTAIDLTTTTAAEETQPVVETTTTTSSPAIPDTSSSATVPTETTSRATTTNSTETTTQTTTTEFSETPSESADLTTEETPVQTASPTPTQTPTPHWPSVPAKTQPLHITDHRFENNFHTSPAKPPTTEQTRETPTPMPTPEPTLHICLTMGREIYSVNNLLYTCDAAPYISDENRAMVPIRFVAQALGAEVGWNAAARAVTINQNGFLMQIKIDSPLPDNMGTAVIKHNRTYVPIRYISEHLGAAASWYPETRTVEIKEFAAPDEEF